MKFQQLITNAGLKQVNWLNPMLIAIIPTLIILSLKPINFQKYTPTKIDSRNLLDYQHMIAYVDFENDRECEQVNLISNVVGNASMFIYDEEGNQMGQFNLPYPYPLKNLTNTLPLIHYDMDGDHSQELALFTIHHDSLLLNIFDFDSLNYLHKNIFIDTIGGFNSHRDFYIYWIQPDQSVKYERNIYFSVAAGFALYPRRVYSYSLKDNVLTQGPVVGTTNLQGLITQRKNKLILVSGNASGNINKDYPFPYHDTCGWLFGFTPELEYAFDPVPVGKHPSGLRPLIPIDNELLGCTHSGSQKTESNYIFKMDYEGNVLSTQTFESKINGIDVLYRHNKPIYLISKVDQKGFWEVNPKNLTTKPSKFLKKSEPFVLRNQDFENDGNMDTYLYDDKLHEVYLFFNNDKGGINIPLSNEDILIANISYSKKGNDFYFWIVTFKNMYQFKIASNPYYWLRIPFILFVYFLSVCFISTIYFFQNRNHIRRQNLEQKIADLQIQNLRNQLDPHFTFNALNSVGNAIYKQSKEEAYDLFQRFTRMIRSSLLVSDKVFRSLNEELTFSRDYLEFQKTRFKGRFEYNIKIDKDMDPEAIQIPKMLIQGFAENAVKHAFYGVEYLGEIKIKGEIDGDKTLITIEDNGIGILRSKQEQYTSGTQKGEKIILEQIKQINRLYKSAIEVEIIDKNTLRKETGTLVKIKLA